MNIIDHLSLGVPDIEEACRFYDGLLETLGCKRLATMETLAAYGNDAVQFVLIKPFDGKEHSAGNGAHICFVANSPAAVDAFHKFATESGGSSEGAPGPRPDYPLPEVYTAFVRDPYGHKLEAIHKGFAS